MPRKSRAKNEAESPAGQPSVEYERLSAQISPMVEALKEQTGLQVASDLPDPSFVERTRPGGPFKGRIASGRGRIIRADDSSFSIEANPGLSAAEHTLAVKNGFDDESPDGTLLIADKKTMREANGDINHVAYALTSRSMDTGWNR